MLSEDEKWHDNLQEKALEKLRHTMRTETTPITNNTDTLGDLVRKMPEGMRLIHCECGWYTEYYHVVGKMKNGTEEWGTTDGYIEDTPEQALIATFEQEGIQ